MRHLPRALIVLLSGAIVLGPAVGTALATTIDDLVKLKTNKTMPVSDDVLIALIEADGSIFHLTADDIVPLMKRGLSDRVIVAMLATAKRAKPTVEVGPPAVEQSDRMMRESLAPVAPLPPVVVNVTQHVTQTVEQPQPQYETRTAYVPVYVPVAVPVQRRPAPEPVYWGFGGQLRPNSWRVTPEPEKPKADPKPDPKKGGGQ